MEIVSVFIPPGEQLFSLYADGDLVRRDGDEEVGYTLEFRADSMLSLFYHSRHHRRCYVTVDPAIVESWGLSRCLLEGVDRLRSVVAVLEGRAFDRFKRTLWQLGRSCPDCHRLKPLFWVRFAWLCRYGRNSWMNVERLLKEFGGEDGV